MRVVVFVGVLIACIHASVWAVSRDIISAPAINGQLASVSYTPFDTHPDGARPSSPEQIRADLKAIAPYTRMVRTYSSTGGAELVPEVAREFGLRVSVGAWIDGSGTVSTRTSRRPCQVTARMSQAIPRRRRTMSARPRRSCRG